MKLKTLLSLYDNGNTPIVINDKNLNMIEKVCFATTPNWSRWLTDHREILNANVMAFGFYDAELCVRINI